MVWRARPNEDCPVSCESGLWRLRSREVVADNAVVTHEGVFDIGDITGDDKVVECAPISFCRQEDAGTAHFGGEDVVDAQTPECTPTYPGSDRAGKTGLKKQFPSNNNPA